MLSKRHYVAIAEVVKNCLDDPYQADECSQTAIESVASALASYFAADNPRFDRARFLAACGVKDSDNA